ncbi:hypothetical protein FPR_19760 [Faecalibacterium prausnitzii SL3/3]|uniref:Uncharacterized protein n=1 Tax=Faecalibacterium prausnitzii SL3/3 TaxID=657322 RepID=D4KBI0_9FIRM|nr:hypothetical protein FPR_19760 [Faecalibacterium prausnitzii SL3/3]
MKKFLSRKIVAAGSKKTARRLFLVL